MACWEAERGKDLLMEIVVVASGLAAREYGGGTRLLASLTVQIKLELSESTVLVAEILPSGRTM